MRVIPCDLVELDDATVWVRTGRRMFRIDDEAQEGIAPLLAPAPIEVVEAVVEVPPARAPAPVKPCAPKREKAPAKQTTKRAVKTKPEVERFRELLSQGTKVSAAARGAGISSSLASYYAKKWREEESLVVTLPPEPVEQLTRRCPNCAQLTATDPCTHCGERIAPKAGVR
jgi:hypothetical protein